MFILVLKFRSSKGLGVLYVPAKAGASPSCSGASGEGGGSP